MYDDVRTGKIFLMHIVIFVFIYKMLICILQTNIVIENYGSAAPLWKRQARVRTSRAVHPELVQTHMYYDGFVYFFFLHFISLLYHVYIHVYANTILR